MTGDISRPDDVNQGGADNTAFPMTTPFGPWEEGIKVNPTSTINVSALASHLSSWVYVVNPAPSYPPPP